MKNHYDAILFDFDGVLADTEPVHYECWKEVLVPLGVQMDWPTFAEHCIGVPDRQAVEILCRLSRPPVDFETAWATSARKQEAFRRKTLEAPPIQPGTIDLLRSLDGVKLGVVTASARSEIEPILVRAGVSELIDVLVCRDDVQRPKPAPDQYLEAARRLGATKVLAVEDSEAGLASARAAGFETLRIDHPANLTGRLRQCLGL
ncbi:MAG: HAD family hydrolase [Bryobacteraceae bacterium]